MTIISAQKIMKQQSTINYCGVLDGWGVMQLATMTKRDIERKSDSIPARHRNYNDDDAKYDDRPRKREETDNLSLMTIDYAFYKRCPG